MDPATHTHNRGARGKLSCIASACVPSAYLPWSEKAASDRKGELFRAFRGNGTPVGLIHLDLNPEDRPAKCQGCASYLVGQIVMYVSVDCRSLVLGKVSSD